MSTTVQILKIVAASVAGTLVLLYFCVVTSILPESPTTLCDSICVEVKDADIYDFVDANDVYKQLKRKGINPVGKTASHSLADSVEKAINGIAFVKKSECYIGRNGAMYISIEQRQPVMLVETKRGSYYVDSERIKIPVSKQDTNLVMVVSGNVKEVDAKGVIFDFVQYLCTSKFYKDNVSRIQIDDNGCVFACANEGVPLIKLGSLDNYELKMNKLKAWYEQYPTLARSQHYSMVDVSYDGLVYCRRQ